MTSSAADEKAQRYQIGEVAERTGVTQRTLRFYEEKGLLNPPERMEGGFRLYSQEDIQRIQYIRQLQQLLGFTLADIKEMVEAEELRQQIIATFRPDRELPARLERTDRIIDALTRQLEVVDDKVEHLQTMQEDLRAKLARMDVRKKELQASLTSQGAGGAAPEAKGKKK
ncbi:MAG: MerR family transcriptional regulator [Dehalococcoidia bacterium]|nr:MerR family transcriptional regulator [Dehalococcoidia bacterium]